jgi:hypothetical protein
MHTSGEKSAIDLQINLENQSIGVNTIVEV